MYIVDIYISLDLHIYVCILSCSQSPSQSHVHCPIPLKRHHSGTDHIPRGGTDLNIAVPDAYPDGPVERRHPLQLELQLDATLFQEEELVLIGLVGGGAEWRWRCYRACTFGERASG